MLIFLLPAVSSCNYRINPDSDCSGFDGRTILGEFNLVWIWISLTIFFIFTMIISFVRDILPRAEYHDVTERYPTGESKNICRFLAEEYLLTGWIFIKAVNRLTNTARMSLIVLIVYSDILITGLLYNRDYSHPHSFKSRDFLYGLVSTAVTFCFYILAYFLLRINPDDVGFRPRVAFGYFFVFTIFSVSTVYLFYFTYKIHDDTDSDYTNLVNHWMAALGFSMLLEFLVSENLRILTRVGILWTKKFDSEEPMVTNIELSSIERVKNYENESFD